VRRRGLTPLARAAITQEVFLTRYLQQEKYADLDGRRVCYVDEGEGPALLLVHGLGGSISNWAPTIEHFKRSRRVIALDLPGFGKSVAGSADGTVECFAHAIRALLAQLGIDRVSRAGNSLGGLITLHLALDHTDLVENVILVDTAGTHAFPELLRAGLKRLPSRWVKRIMLFSVSYIVRYRFAYRLAGIYNLNEYTRVLLDEAIGTASRPDLEEYLDMYYKAAITALDTRLDERLGEIAKPVLIVWGQKDMGVPLKVGQRINKLIKGSFLVAIPKAAHVPQLDQPEAFNLAVERFLAGAEAARGPR
jgi:4,5:9,10-diseco-3-hydroxy-5,9,17-trioxoandrosta-1(10),2-diene-4-oate hydrolase